MMKLIEVVENVFVLPGTENSSNIYFLDGRVPTVIDTGVGDQPLPIDVKKIVQVINTHCHFDHIGGNILFEKARIVMHEDDAKAVWNREEDIILNRWFGNREMLPRVDRTVCEGDKLEAGNLTLKVLHTPGHTAGSICLYEPIRKLLFSGDTLFAYGFGRTDLPTGNEKDMEKSLDRLARLEKKTLLPGHGEWVLVGEEAVR